MDGSGGRRTIMETGEVRGHALGLERGVDDAPWGALRVPLRSLGYGWGGRVWGNGDGYDPGVAGGCREGPDCGRSGGPSTGPSLMSRRWWHLWAGKGWRADISNRSSGGGGSGLVPTGGPRWQVYGCRRIHVSLLIVESGKETWSKRDQLSQKCHQNRGET